MHVLLFNIGQSVKPARKARKGIRLGKAGVLLNGIDGVLNSELNVVLVLDSPWNSTQPL